MLKPTCVFTHACNNTHYGKILPLNKTNLFTGISFLVLMNDNFIRLRQCSCVAYLMCILSFFFPENMFFVRSDCHILITYSNLVVGTHIDVFVIFNKQNKSVGFLNMFCLLILHRHTI